MTWIDFVGFWKWVELTDNLPRITDTSEVLRRQVVDSWMAGDKPMSVAFRPTPKDKRNLSTDRGRISPENSFDGYHKRTGTKPHSTWPVPVEDVLKSSSCLEEKVQITGALEVVDDGGTDELHDGHASVRFSKDYGGESNSQIRKNDERLAKELKKAATRVGCLFSPKDLGA